MFGICSICTLVVGYILTQELCSLSHEGFKTVLAIMIWLASFTRHDGVWA